ncbi:hypothetical protein HDE78_004222 [Rhodanobacter sp. K2T2]|uniref:hypothetical protein n=1 Tax=Rhodanobacter sp. K2T2 TaxID=2723085 RepID=UPI0018082809|nr:hypothetical protein [Rhodanobacter sp. K2T2]NYE31238.1 hypothetical protein [Rhodanobacter sp. K2T2]
METLFTQALGLSAPWRVVNVDFRPAEGLIAFQIDNPASGWIARLAARQINRSTIGCRVPGGI